LPLEERVQFNLRSKKAEGCELDGKEKEGTSI
jgi:hypothetical protein